MKKIYLVKRKSKIGYDEFDSCVIIANNVEELHDMIDNRDVNWEMYKNPYIRSNYWDKGKEDREIIEIDLSSEKSMFLLSSFNAG